MGQIPFMGCLDTKRTIKEPIGVRCVTIVLSQLRDDFMVLLNEVLRLNNMPFGFSNVFEEEVTVHIANIRDNLLLRL
jgi:hypothetical protein